MALKRRRQIINRGIRFAKGATGPYARKLSRTMQARACVRSSSNGGLWKDPPDFIGSGWTDNGDGTYTCNGSDGTSLEVTNAGIIDNETYDVSINFISYTGGAIDVYLGGQSNFKENNAISGSGVISFLLTIDDPFVPVEDMIIINSASFVGTIGNISVTQT